MTSIAVLQALAVTAELTGTQLSEAGARVMASDLAPYPEIQVLGALTRCRKELKGRLTVSDIVTRLEDGRPGAEEAWAMLPRNEVCTTVWTEEISASWGIVHHLIADGDRIAARMAFLENYRARVQKARDAGIPVKWTVSFGFDEGMRRSALEDAIRRGRLTEERAQALGYRPEAGASAIITEFIQPTVKRLTGE